MRLIKDICIGFLAVAVIAPVNAFSSDLTVTTFSTFAGQSNIQLEATGNIIFSGSSLMLPALPPGAATGQLLVQAGGDVIIQNSASIPAVQGWLVSMMAGANLGAPGTVTPGSGNVTLQGTASLATADGSISLLAGDAVTVGTGFIHTTGGGGISVNAVSGSVNTGTRTNGFIYKNNPATPYVVDANVGGISTAAGGDVTITAGGDISSLLPAGNNTADGGSGAFGPSPGNVTLTAGGNVTGHYVLRNGTGTIMAGENAGINSAQLALSLVSGSWDVKATNDILLQEVRDPNGVFNNAGPSSSKSYHFFDYAPGATVSLNAGGAVQLLGVTGSLPRNATAFDTGIGPIYAPTLSISAGAGGLGIANDIRLFPSANGSLNLSTTNGGSLASSSPSGSIVQLVISDSSATQYSSSVSFGPNDHAASPVHLNDPVPTQLDISGDVNTVMLVSPKLAAITIGGGMINSRMAVQNLDAGDVTSLLVAGDIESQTATGGYIISGPGLLNIAANNLDLGASAGIQSTGSLSNPALAALGASGADVTITLSGNLDMVSNAISSVAGGSIDVNAQGYINVGSINFQGSNNAALGIFTSAKADVSVTAGGDIELSNSRIAAYDGGNILVDSTQGSVDASIPGSDLMTVTKVFGNPAQSSTSSFSGNGILAATFPDSAELVGNITVEAAQNIVLGCGAVTQEPLNGTSGATAVLEIKANKNLITEAGCASISGAGTVEFFAQGFIGSLLSAQVNVGNLTAVAGTDAQFIVTAGGIGPFTYQWHKGDTNIQGATNATLSLTNIHRSDAGNYSIVVSNETGTVTNQIQLHVLVPQLLSASPVAASSMLDISFDDGDGEILTAADIPTFVIQSSTNLIDWTTANVPVSTNASGLSFQVALPPDSSRNFYRVLSQ